MHFFYRMYFVIGKTCVKSCRRYRFGSTAAVLGDSALVYRSSDMLLGVGSFKGKGRTQIVIVEATKSCLV